MKITLISVGKTKERWLEEALSDYLRRMSSYLTVEFQFVKEDAQLIRALEKQRSVICLDPAGEEMDSVQLSGKLQKWLEDSGGRLTFVIGGPEGLPQELRSRWPLLSLSRLTLTHQMVRLLLVEQLYRAIEIQKGSGYHK